MKKTLLLLMLITLCSYSEIKVKELQKSDYFTSCKVNSLDKKLHKAFLPFVKTGQLEGCNVVQIDNSLYLIAFGSTTIKDKKGAMEKLRQLKVSKAIAYRALAKFVHGMKVKSKQNLKTEVTCVDTNSESRISTKTVLTESIYLKTKGFIRTLPKVGTWVDTDGSFYTALAGELAEKYSNKK